MDVYQTERHSRRRLAALQATMLGISRMLDRLGQSTELVRPSP
jgi:hypothetical protein